MTYILLLAASFYFSIIILFSTYNNKAPSENKPKFSRFNEKLSYKHRMDEESITGKRQFLSNLQHKNGNSTISKSHERKTHVPNSKQNRDSIQHDFIRGRLKDSVKVTERRIQLENSALLRIRPDAWCRGHNRTANAVFTIAMDNSYRKNDAEKFVGTLRQAKFRGDIIVAILPGAEAGFVETLRRFNCIVYTIGADVMKCTSPKNQHDKRCKFALTHSTGYSVNMIRFFLYQIWSMIYSEISLILVSGFRDVFFQSDPFEYSRLAWGPPRYQLTIFQEAYPNKMIYRCPFNSEWIKNCYGSLAYKMVSDNMVSCSGTTLGTRDAILVYSSLITQQLKPEVRYFKNALRIDPSSENLPKDNLICINSNGVDQGFHNFVLYSGQLEEAGVKIKRYPQGEGPVNTIGAYFSGPNALIKMTLIDWKVVRGEPPNQAFYNWNGDRSPCVHQYDRYEATIFHNKLHLHLETIKNLFKNTTD